MERPLRARLLSIVAAGLLALAGAGCGGDDEESDTGGAGTSAGETSGGGSLEPETSTAPVAEGCRDVRAPEPKPEGGERRPREPLPEGSEPRLRVKTNCGSFTITLDPETAPQAGASLVALANADFFDGTIFHRIVPGFVIQGGDPTGTGTGGPGYTTEDPPPQDQVYTRGVVAMAKTGNEPPGAAGSQFFVARGRRCAPRSSAAGGRNRTARLQVCRAEIAYRPLSGALAEISRPRNRGPRAPLQPP